MRSVLGVALLLLTVCGGVAYGARTQESLDRWDAVESLMPGAEINVLSGNQAGPDVCVVSSVDENALTCLAENPAADTRLVFPRGAVRDVWVFEQGRERHIGAWIGVGIGFVVGGALCVEGGPGAFFVCGSLGAGFMGGLITEQLRPGPFGYPGPMRPPRPPRWRRRLVYRAPLSAVSP
jgi:uncharacterized protein YcfJ